MWEAQPIVHRVTLGLVVLGSLRKQAGQAVVAQAFNPSTQEAEAGRSL